VHIVAEEEFKKIIWFGRKNGESVKVKIGAIGHCIKIFGFFLLKNLMLCMKVIPKTSFWRTT